MRKRTLTDDQVKQIKSDFMAGVKRKDLTQKYSIGLSLVDAILRERLYADIVVPGFTYTVRPVRIFRMTEELRQKAKDLLAEGKNPNQVANILGVTPPTIYKLAKKLKEVV